MADRSPSAQTDAGTGGFEAVFGMRRGQARAPVVPQPATPAPDPESVPGPPPHPLLALTSLLTTNPPNELHDGNLLKSAHLITSREYEAQVSTPAFKSSSRIRRTAMFSLGTRRADGEHEFVVSYRNRGNGYHCYCYNGPDLDEALRVFNQLTAEHRLRRTRPWKRTRPLTADEVESAVRQLAGYAS